MNKNVNTFDIDGVIFLGKYGGVYPGPQDLIITGRSIEEAFDTLSMLRARGITNQVFFNALKYENKSRESSGRHKAGVLGMLYESGFKISIHFEDDPVQKDIIEASGVPVTVVYINQNLITLENSRHR